jgi:sugar lactone lactonase YvrE
MVRKLIGNANQISGIYELDDSASLSNKLDNLSRYVYDNKSTPLIPGNIGNITDLYISPDETKLYVIDSSADTIYQNSLSDGYIFSDYNNLKSFLLSGQDGSPQGVYIGAAGTAMYIVGNTNDTIYQYTLSTAYDVSTISYSGISSLISARETNPTDITFSDDGTKVYVVGQTAAGAGLISLGEYVHQFNLTTAWNVGTAGYSTSFYVNPQTSTAPNGLTIGAGGTAMYVNNSTTVYQYTLGTAWQVNTASYTNKSLLVSGQDTTQSSIYFKDDGTKLYTVGAINDNVYEYSLGIPWDISTASYDTEFFYVGAQDATSTGLYIAPDGKNVYVTGSTSSRVNQYPLRTAWDLKTVDVTPSLFIGFLEGTAQSLYFKPDGTSVYILGSVGDRIYQIPLNTPWDLRTSGISSISAYPVAAQDITSVGVYIGAAGTAMYIVGSTSDTIYQYTLGTAYDVSTASYSGISSVISARETDPTDITFSDDGTKVYVVGQTGVGLPVASGEYVHQFNLSTAWNVGTAGYSTSFNVSQESAPTGVYIGAAGTAMYVVGTANDTVYQYTLGTAWQVNTASYTNVSFSINTQDAGPQSIYFKDDGTKMYMLGSTNDAIHQYSLSTAWNVSTASYENKSLYVGAHEGTSNGLYFSPDGTSIYIVGSGNDRVVRYPLSTAWDISTWVQSFYVGTQETVPNAIYFKPDGTIVYILGTSQDTIFQYSLTTPWDLTTASYTNKSFSITLFEVTPTGLHFSSDGTRVYVVGNTNDRVHLFKLATAWDISTAFNPYNIKSFSVNSQDTSPQGVYIGADGTAMYIMGDTNNTIYQYTLGTAYDVSTASYSGISSNITTRETVPQDLTFSDDGTKVYVVGQAAAGAGLIAGAEYVHQFNLTTAWNVGTAGYSTSFYVTTQTSSTPAGLTIGAGGTAMYVNNSSNVYQYTLGTAWEVNTSSYTSKTFVISTQDAGPQSIYFKDNGTKMYMLGSINDAIYQYSLSTPWDISTTSSDTKLFNVGGQETNANGLYFKPDGKTVYIVGSTGDAVVSYDLDIPWEISSFSKSLNVATQEVGSTGVRLTEDLSKLYIVGSARLNSYDFLT